MNAKAAFRIRPTLLSDEAAVSTLLRCSYAALMPAGYDQALLARLLPVIGQANPALLASGTYYVAVADAGLIIGAGGWTLNRPGDSEQVSKTGHIRHFGSHPDWAGRGVGSSLFDRCLAQAQAAGVRRFECYASLNAVDFYRKLGFKAINPVNVPIGGKTGLGTDLIMPAMLMERLL